MLDRLPKYIDPLHLADKRSVLKGLIPLDCFERLASLLLDDTGSIAVDLNFRREGKLAVIEGRIESELHLVCQNCLQDLVWPVDNRIKLAVVGSIDEADRLPGDYEPLLLEEEKILLKDIVEDELLLILPQYPKHPHDCLGRSGNLGETGSEPQNSQPDRENPFSILTHLKLSETKNGRTKK
ncbi:YceD family protein [Methylosarcina fibrata]|uniref:YceD family protein n=1 Tax=Methylosarcina fibrata TaxID=105972 RepID=UPI000367FADD|nr:YceD family protein [Methylosarcina fibrata]